MTANIWHLLERAATLYHAQTAVEDEHGLCWTYGELHQCALALATRLIATTQPGARVAVLDHNTPHYLAAYFAAAAAGVVLVPLNVRLGPADMAAILDHASAHVLLAGDDLKDEAAAAAAQAAHTAVQPIADDGHPGASTRLAAIDTTAHLYYTSGTTGQPKGVQLSHQNVTTHALAAIAELHLSDADTWAHIAPLFHLADAWATFAITWVGGRHLTRARFSPQGALDTLEAGTTITNLVPTMLNMMVAHPSAATRDWSRMRRILSGGAPIAPEVVRRIRSTLGCEYVQTYGMTETSPYLTLSTLTRAQKQLPEAEQLRIASRTGRPFATVELRVVADGDAARPQREVPRDDQTVGEIQVRGPTVTCGYFDDPEQTRAAFTADGFLRTGDLATVDATGSVQIVDRSKDVILTGGETVYSIEVENVLYRHPAVLEAAVVGRPHPTWGEAITAVVALRAADPETPRARAPHAEAQPTADDLRTFCREHLPGYKCPKTIELVDALPRTGSGKIAKRMLRRP